MTHPKFGIIFLVLNILLLCHLASSQNLKQPRLCDPNVQQYSGYFNVNNNKNLFFWFFESRNNPKQDPIVLWNDMLITHHTLFPYDHFSCSAMNSLYFELGPCSVNSGGNSTSLNQYSFNNNASVIFLDQPVNSGYSYGDYVSDTLTDAKDIYTFLQMFFRKHPQYSNLTFHIASESYGGHYAPALASIIQSNKNSTSTNRTRINLDSILIGNGLVTPLVQFKSFPTMACDSSYGSLFDNSTCSQMIDNSTQCANLIQTCYNTKAPKDCVFAKEYCYDTLIIPVENTGRNILDIRQQCSGILCYPDFIDIIEYANSAAVKNELGINSSLSFQLCNNNINVDFIMSTLLDGNIRVLVYTGDADYLCNWFAEILINNHFVPGNDAWTRALSWSGSAGFNNVNFTKWITAAGDYSGDFRTFKGLTFLRVFNASHMVPHDQPAASLDFFNKWIFKQEF
ncbi:10239_t:CDS:2 [Dentiscutata heterogama]|uniref:10239_t:CDS:1 n=1 Tax=Dentiscutata heterogama TaxID=1316150 RepID=A0ACA9L712_9GLOM|nr:10239_t:CDS:2 [Dentiscutata heterogama]